MRAYSEVTFATANRAAFTGSRTSVTPISHQRVINHATGSETNLQILVESLTLRGGGQVVLSDDSNNVIFGGAANATLINVDNTISGAGHIGAGQMALVNAGTIIADGTQALVIDTGSTLSKIRCCAPGSLDGCCARVASHAPAIV